MPAFLSVYSKKTGKKHSVPAHVMDQPRLAAPFRKTPKQNAADTAALGSATPATDDTIVPSATPETPAAGA